MRAIIYRFVMTMLLRLIGPPAVLVKLKEAPHTDPGRRRLGLVFAMLMGLAVLGFPVLAWWWLGL